MFEPFLITEKPQSGAEAKPGFAGELITELGKELLRCRVLGVCIDAENEDAARPGDLLGMTHERFGDALSAKLGVDGKAMSDDGLFADIPADVGVLRLLIFGDGGYARYCAIDYGDPKLLLRYVAKEDLCFRISIVPLQIAASAHEGYDTPYQRHDLRDVFSGRLLNFHEPIVMADMLQTGVPRTEPCPLV